MSDSLVYALIQVLHNLGAALALGGALFGGVLRPPGRPQGLLSFLAVIWSLQGLTGVGFGVASLLIYGALPDLHPIAWGALSVKAACVIAGLGLALSMLLRGPETVGRPMWAAHGLLAAAALSAAAVLRWYS